MIAGVHHVALRARDVEAVAEFYRLVLGLRRGRVQRDERGVRSMWLRAGATLIMIERRERGEPAVPAGTMEALLFAIAPDQRARAERRLARHGVALEGSTGFSLYLRDPEGRRVGLSHHPRAAPARQSTTARASEDGEPRGRRGS